jgi:hypothetical protein
MNVNILTQVIRQGRYSTPATSAPLRSRKNDIVANEDKLVYKDVAGFIIFLVIAFSILMIVFFN